VALDYFAVGLLPDQNTIFVQSQIPELCELTYYLMNLVSVQRLQRNPTVKDELKLKKKLNSVSAGFLCYPISQAADILAFDTDLVPIGADQLPMIEQTNEIARKFNSVYNVNCFKPVKSLIGKVGRLPGIDGYNKMSKSLGNAIYLKDSTDQIKEKVNQMYTDPKHIRVTDPGTVEGHVVFKFLDYLDPDKKTLDGLKDRYRSGGLGDGALKKRLIDILDQLISPIRERRVQLSASQDFIMKSLETARLRAREKAQVQLLRVKRYMHLLR
jgi:tryptophanyl-tRNA synthetase